MIQRIQSLYLLAAAIAILLMYWFPLADFGAYAMHTCYIKGPENEPGVTSMIALALLPLLSALISLVSLLKYKSRKLQLKLGWFNSLVLISILAIELIYMVKIGEKLHIKAIPEFISIMPVVAILFVLLANRAIKKDDNLVKSADRIR